MKKVFEQDLSEKNKLIVFQVDDKIYYRLYYYQITNVTSRHVGPFETLTAAVSHAYKFYEKYKTPPQPQPQQPHALRVPAVSKRFYGDRCRNTLPDYFVEAYAAAGYTSWHAECGCSVEIDKGETVFVDPTHPEGAWVSQRTEEGKGIWHYCPDIEVEI